MIKLERAHFGLYWSLIAVCLFGVILRFFHIFSPEFVFYDEGLYLAHNINFLYYMEDNPPQSISQFFHYLNLCWHKALADTKIIWFFLANMRTFLLDTQAIWFTRFLSAVFGSLTIWVTYLFGKKYFQNTIGGLISAALLAVLPSHVFYSRLGMQESISTLFFMIGLYFYVFSKKFDWKVGVSGFAFACLFFCNYRMIIVPIITLAIELYIMFFDKQKFRYRIYVYNTLIFFAVIFIIGAFDRGANTRITFGWMFHQANLAKGTFSFLNLLSYPYYLFRLESFVFGLLFFSGIYLAVQKKWNLLLPFMLVILQMIIFSFPQEKGVRYLSGALPIMAVTVCGVILFLWQEKRFFKWALIVLCLWMFSALIWKSVGVASFRSSYDNVIEDITQGKNKVKIISTQPVILRVIAGKHHSVAKPVFTLRQFVLMYKLGYRYFVLDPQVYVSMTQSGKRFDPELSSFLGFIKAVVPPEKIYGHFNKDLMERFVLEHNENFKQSLRFLREHNVQKNRALYLYDIKKIIYTAQHYLKQGL